MKRISILGSTGSIGVQALDVVRCNPDSLEIVALATGSNVDLIESQVREFRPGLISVPNEKVLNRLRDRVKDLSGSTEMLFGDEGLNAAATFDTADLVVGALPGSVGLRPAFETISAGKDLALATKEVLVMAGGIFMEQVRNSNVSLTPVDSEESAIFQCLQGYTDHKIQRILLTASGGPFLRKTLEDMLNVTKEETLNHPRWKMGPKVTVDSATLMNKGLEVIETRWLFDVRPEQIEVVIHPQSLVHSMVEFTDGSILAQIGATDMKVPISYALGFPRRICSGTMPLDFTKIEAFTFEKPDKEKFPLLKAAYDSLFYNETVSPVILNAADEVAVGLFLRGRIPFSSIAGICLDALDSIPCSSLVSLDDIEQFHDEVKKTVHAKWDRPI